MRLRAGLFVAATVALTGFSCSERGGKNINEGEINYTIQYFGSMGSFKDLMPKTLIVSFKDNKILFDISAPIGNSGIMNLSNPAEGIFDTYISLLSWRYYYPAKSGETQPGFDGMKDMNIRKTSKTAQICGFNCKNAEVTLPGNPDSVYQVWYTNEIKIKNPNVSNPFAEIDGVLMSFFFFMGDAEMHFTAETVFRKDIPDKLFERRQKYQRISREEISKFIDKLISL